MAADVMTRPPVPVGWEEVDDDEPRPPEAPQARWPIALDLLDSAQARRAREGVSATETRA